MHHPESFTVREEIVTGGSIRRFFRIRQHRNTYILIQGPDLDEYLAIQRHLRRHRIGVPRMIKVLAAGIIIEDVGDHSLYSLMRRHPRSWRSWYRPVIKELVRMQVLGRVRPPMRRRYDDEHMRWEQDYFQEHFLSSYCGCKARDLRPAAGDLKRLRLETAAANEPFDGFFMHRDFQSQNIIICDRRPRFIDFQSARIGPLTYDLASLLHDPYVKLGSAQGQGLYMRYLEHLRAFGISPDPERFYRAYELTSIQRMMQALGAFANLGLNKNKPHFLSHIPRGVSQLKRGLRKMGFSSLIGLIANRPSSAARRGKS